MGDSTAETNHQHYSHNSRRKERALYHQQQGERNAAAAAVIPSALPTRREGRERQAVKTEDLSLTEMIFHARLVFVCCWGDLIPIIMDMGFSL